MGPSGPVGLDYNVLFYLMDKMGLSKSEHANLFGDIRVVESEALTIINKRDE
jgi:hypothetical protein